MMDISAAHVAIVVLIFVIGFCAGWIARAGSADLDRDGWPHG